MASGGTDDTLTVTERFTRSGPDSLHYEFTVDDPTHFSQAFSGEFPFTAFPADELPFLFE